MSSAVADRDAFDSLSPPSAAVIELQGERHVDACRDLEQGVLKYLREEARIERRRCFLLQPGTGWNSMEKFVDHELATTRAKRVSFDWHDPGIDLIAVWKLGRFGSGRIAVAMGSQLIDGQPIVGYFDLK
jgi:hypothetical protein